MPSFAQVTAIVSSTKQAPLSTLCRTLHNVDYADPPVMPMTA